MDVPCKVCGNDSREVGGVMVNGMSLCYPCIGVAFQVIVNVPNGSISLDQLKVMRGVEA